MLVREDPSPAMQLAELLRNHFGGPSELRDFVRALRDGEALAGGVAFERVSMEECVERTVERLARRTRVDSALFDALARRFEAAEPAIRRVQGSWQKLILFLSATPRSLPDLAVREEARLIRAAITESRASARFGVIERHHVQTAEWRREVELWRPAIVHFSGHGNLLGRLVLENGDAAVDLPHRPMLRQLAEVGVEGAVFSACHSDRLAYAATAEGVSWAIGMHDPVRDDVAVRFARGFYEGLALERSSESSFEYALQTSEWEREKRPRNPIFSKRR